MLDNLLDIIERDRSSSSPRTGGLRGRLATLLGDSHEGSVSASSRDRDSARQERDWDDDDRHDRDDDDRSDRRPSTRKRKREFDLFDFGD